jgi:23S rRNA pseudouridine1911/1915/1917 synthase
VVRQIGGERRIELMREADARKGGALPDGMLSGRIQMRTTFFTAAAEDVGERLDRVVTAHCPELSRTRAQELIEAGLVLVEGRTAKGSSKVHDGQRITVEEQPRAPMSAQPESIPLDVLYEDDDVIVIDKAAGMTVHAGAGNPTGTLVNALLGRGQGLSQSADLLRPGIVHRLDKDTSGAILVAKNDFAHAKVAEDFRQRVVKKTYLALVEGSLGEASGRIELAISRDPLRRTRMTTRRSAILQNAREARTDWRVLACLADTTLVEVELHTGRTHQIRVHFAALKHPVVGDTLYGAASRLRVGNNTLPPLERNFLHAAKLGFRQPRSGAWVEVRAPLPEKLRDFLRELATVSRADPGVIDAALAPYL